MAVTSLRAPRVPEAERQEGASPADSGGSTALLPLTLAPGTAEQASCLKPLVCGHLWRPLHWLLKNHQH